jgi:hypothetical protein
MWDVRTSVAALGVATLVPGCVGQAPTPYSDVTRSIAHEISVGSEGLRIGGTRRRTLGTLIVDIRIPRDKHRRGESPRYISPATNGMSLTFVGPTRLKEAIGLTPSSPGCTISGGATNCRTSARVLPGRYTASVSTFNQAPVGGSIPGTAKLLSTASHAPFTINAGFDNAVNFTLSGVPSSFVISGMPSGSAGTAFVAQQNFVVTAKDAGGYTIVGAYDTAVTLADSDSTGATTLATTGSDDPPAGELLSSSDVPTLTYTGLAISPATISVQASGATEKTATFAPALSAIVIGTSDSMNPSFAGVDLYAPSGAGSLRNFTASEIGWTNSPYNKSFNTSAGTGCSSFANVVPVSNTSFDAVAVPSPEAGTCTFTFNDGAGQSQAVTLAYTSYAYTGTQVSLRLPPGVNTMTVDAAGAQGGSGYAGAAGADGGTTDATVRVTGYDTLFIDVGGMGGSGTFQIAFCSDGAGGFDGGGSGGEGEPTYCGGGGGGSSTVFVALSQAILVVAGGGGGGGSTTVGGAGGAAMGATVPGATGGGGGNQSTGGNGGGGDEVGAAGAYGLGGNGAAGLSGGGGGGGGGYYGGGGGGACDTSCTVGGGGGGGSSYAIAGSTNVDLQQGGQSGNGYVTIIW